MSESRQRWTLRDAIRFYEQYGHLGPYQIRGGENEGGNSNGTNGAGSGGGANQNQQNQNGNQNQQQGGNQPDLSGELSNERSANKLIKDFAKERGITVADLVQQFKTAEDSQKTALEKAQDAAKTWEQKYGDTATELQKERAEKAIRDAAADANANPQRLSAIFRLVKDDIEYGEDGKPKNVADLITKAKKESPEWFRAASGSGDGGKGGDGPKDANERVNQAIRQAAGR